MTKRCSCGAKIKFIRTKAGRKMPVEATKRSMWLPATLLPPGPIEVLVTEGGEVLRGVPIDQPAYPGYTSVTGYRSHFAACPHAPRYRR